MGTPAERFSQTLQKLRFSATLGAETCTGRCPGFWNFRGLKSWHPRRRAPPRPVFGDLEFDPAQGYSNEASKRLNRYIRSLIDDDRKVYHSLRHTFKTIARNSGVPEDCHDFITGHAGQLSVETMVTAPGCKPPTPKSARSKAGGGYRTRPW